jgi:glycosyltransferase involved in cell wall biosynthesis
MARRLRIETLLRARRISAALDTAAANADLLHLHSNGLIIEVAAQWARRRGVPFVLTLYGTEIWHYRRRWLFDPFTRAFAAAHAVTFYSRRLLDRARELGLDRRGLSVIYPPVSDVFAPQPVDVRRAWREVLGITEPILLLNVKRLHELAGQRFLLQAFARATRGRHDVRLVICGTGPLREALQAEARDLGIAGKTTFAGLVDNETVARYAAVADLFVLPSLLEALPTVAVEALASGTPVLSADHPGGLELHEIFGDDVEVVAKGSADQLADALVAQLGQPRRVTGDTLRSVEAQFRKPAIEAAYRAVYAEAAPGSRT